MSTPADLRRTPLHAAHVAAGGRLVPFAGWEMPVQYASVLDEHHAVRRAAGMFDVSHMGELEVTGPGALAAVQGLVTNDVTRLADGQALYTVMCNAEGGIVDDLIVYRLGPEHVLLCVNAATTEKDAAWVGAAFRGLPGVKLEDTSARWAQLAVAGPKAAAIVGRLAGFDPATVPAFHFVRARIGGVEALCARTGYTGEDGFEIFIRPEGAAPLWDALREAGVVPCGLGARDSLRLEMRYPLYGSDIDDTTNPLEAGLGWVVKLEKSHFAGRTALVTLKASPARRRLVGFELEGRGIARHGFEILAPKPGAPVIGRVTSGGWSPSLDRAIGMGYVPVEFSAPGSALDVSIRGKPVRARIVETPFYRRAGKS